MAMTGAGLAAARKAAVDAVAIAQTNNATSAQEYGEAWLLADSTAIVTYIQGNAQATGTDTGTNGGSTHALAIV